jgi:hypothetical protein
MLSRVMIEIEPKIAIKKVKIISLLLESDYQKQD